MPGVPSLPLSSNFMVDMGLNLALMISLPLFQHIDQLKLL